MTRGFALWAGLAALAAVVVAGVTIAVFPHEQRTALPGPVLVPRVAPAPPVAVTFPPLVVGRTTHASLMRGGAATPTTTDVGRIAVKASTRPPTVPSPAAIRVSPEQKKTPKRPTSIGGSTGSNGDVGLASGSSAGAGEQSAGHCAACP